MIIQKTKALLFLLTLLCPLHAASADSIVLYDLRYALDIDTNRPEEVDMAWDHCHTTSTLQGVVNRTGPELYLIYVNAHGRSGTNLDRYWLDKYTKEGRWLAEKDIVQVKSIPELVKRFRSSINGAVVYDPKVPATSNAASTIAGVRNLVAVRYDPSPGSLYTQLILKGPRLPVKCRLLSSKGKSMFTGKGRIPGTDRQSTGSAKCDVYIWLKHNYIDRGLCNCEYGAYYIDYFWVQRPTATVLNHHTLTNHDFFVSQKAFFFDLSPWGDEPPTDDPQQKPGTDRATMKELLLSAYKQTGGGKIIHIGGFPPWAFKYTTHAGSKHDGVPTEWEYAKIMSAYNAFKDADAIGLGAMANASFWAHYPLKKHYPQKWVTRSDLKKRGYLTSSEKVRFDGREFIIFYVGDYDSASWVYQRVHDIWDDPNRGKLPMMWCISPVLDRRAAMAMDYMRETATGLDFFAAADNGAGYLNPGMLQEPRPISGLPSGLNAWAAHCKRFYRRWDITITGFVIDGYAPGLNEKGLACYEKFSPNGIVPQKVPPSLLFHSMPVLRAGWDVNQGDPREAARVVVDRVGKRNLPFHWFRNILKRPTWYVNVYKEIKTRNPKIELLDAPTFFELYRVYLQNNPRAAEGKL